MVDVHQNYNIVISEVENPTIVKIMRSLIRYRTLFMEFDVWSTLVLFFEIILVCSTNKNVCYIKTLYCSKWKVTLLMRSRLVNNPMAIS